MNLASIAYVPPPNGRAQAFHTNITRYKTRYPVFIYSNHNWPGANVSIADPAIVRSHRAPFAISNCVFLFGLKLAMDEKLDYFLYLEDDCRVRGDGWDGKIFDEFLSHPNPIFGGTPVAYHIASNGMEALRRSWALGNDYLKKTGIPMAVYGGFPVAINGHRPAISIYPNGALGVYHVPTLMKIFPGFTSDIGRHALAVTAWDKKVGDGFWSEFQLGIFDRFVPLTTVYSGYSDDLFSENDRRNMLLSGPAVAVHQIKSDWIP